MIAAGIALRAAPARAATEEFSTFDPEAQERDDESVIDHYLARFPGDWRDEWERAPQAIRTSQACLTSGLWMIDTELKLTSPLGRSARFGLDLHQDQSDILSYEYWDFTFRFPTRYGAFTALFRPQFEKSRQDFGLTWSLGADTTAHQLDLIFGLEDAFNNFWEFRQTQVGNNAAPYERHPWEPALRYVARHADWRAEIGGRYLTPARRRIQDFGTPSLSRLQTLWGTFGRASLEARALGLEWEADGENRQALSTDRPVTPSLDDHHDFRRSWSGGFAVRRRWRGDLTTEARWFYVGRHQDYGLPIGPGTFDGIDRVLALEALWTIDPRWTVRLGGLHDRVTITKTGVTPWISENTRVESRAFVGLRATFGRVHMEGVEGIEMDPEPYDVWFVHDKGFLRLQTTF